LLKATVGRILATPFTYISSTRIESIIPGSSFWIQKQCGALIFRVHVVDKERKKT